MKRFSTLFSSAVLTSVLVASQAGAATVELRLLETTDIHTNVMDYDYYRDQSTESFGLIRVASLIKQARFEATNSVLVDNGDLIQGSPMADWRASEGLDNGEMHPVYKVMNELGYNVGNLGNHEFNYGLEYLNQALAGANFPYINANVVDLKTGKNLFKPYLIQEQKVTDTDGNTQTLKVGYIGFVPPQIMQWDRKHLEGKVEALDITKQAEKLVPQMRAEGADVVIAIPHSGISTEPYKTMAENSVYYLSQVEGIDAIMFGHSHGTFPSADFTDIPGVDVEQGTINGVPAVMPGRWANHLGIIDLELNDDSGEWKTTKAKGFIRSISDSSGKPAVERDEKLADLLKDDHKATRDFVNQPIGKSSDLMYSYLALVQDDPTVQIVNNAQIDYVERFIQGDPDLDGIPVLSAAAPFKVGGRKNDPANFTEVEAGTLTFRNAADLYLYPNTLVAVKVTGSDLKEWLERSAGQFNQIDTTSTARQELINWDTFRTYNFDVIDGVDYQIDISQPSRYNEQGQVVDTSAERIVGLTFNGKPVDPKQTFIIATNNYRAYGGGNFAGTGDDNIVFASPDENRQILSDYIASQTKEHGLVVPVADNNWQLSPIKSDVELDIVFETGSSAKAKAFVQDRAVYDVQNVGQDDIGFDLYRIDLTAKQ